ncbi:hypothetical protein [Dapis sp. BLCC M229]
MVNLIIANAKNNQPSTLATSHFMKHSGVAPGKTAFVSTISYVAIVI